MSKKYGKLLKEGEAIQVFILPDSRQIEGLGFKWKVSYKGTDCSFASTKQELVEKIIKISKTKLGPAGGAVGKHLTM